MSNIFKILFEIFTDPLGLPINPVYEYIILAVIGLIAYIMSYHIVGNLYHGGMIGGRMEGSLFHWSIRLFLFIVMWLVARAVISGYFFVTSNSHLFTVILLCMACPGLLWAVAEIVRIITKA